MEASQLSQISTGFDSAFEIITESLRADSPIAACIDATVRAGRFVRVIEGTQT